MSVIFNPTDKRIFNQAKALGMADAVALNVVAQARLESADYTSNVYRSNNNAFGYKFVGQKLATQGSPVPGSEASSGAKYYARYKNIEDSTTELVQWLLRRIKDGQFKMNELTTPESYATAIRRAPFQYYGSSLANYTKNMQAKIKLLTGGTGISNSSNLALPIIIFSAFLLLR